MRSGLLLSFIFIFTAQAGASQGYLTASGCSVSNLGYLTDLAREYERLTGTKIFVRGGGSVVGIEDLRNGKVDFAAACRGKEEGDPREIEFVQVAWDVLVFIVNRSNPLDNITAEDVRSVYAGKLRNWRELKGKDSPIKIFISRPKKGLSGVEASMRSLVLKNREPVETPNTLFVASTAIVEQMVEESPEGFATTGYSSARRRNLKMLKVDGVAPTIRNISNGKYDMKRPLFILLPGKPKPEAKKFVEFALSRQGQQYIRSLGAIPLK